MGKIGLLWATFISTQNAFLLKYGSLFPFWEYLVILCIREISLYYGKNDDDAFLLDRTSITIIFVMWWSRWYDKTCTEYLFKVWIAVLVCFEYFSSFVLRTKWSAFRGSHNYKHQSPKNIIFNCSQQELYIRDWGLVIIQTFF